MRDDTAARPERGRGLVWELLLIVLAGGIAYSNTLHVPFTFDDWTSIVENDVIHDLRNYFSGLTGYVRSPNRFVGSISFAVNYHFGGLDVTGYHAVNLGIHLACALLVYTLLRQTLRTPYFQPQTEAWERNERLHRPHFLFRPWSFIPLLTALLFVVHPIQTQAVTYTVQRFTSLCALFYLGALVLYGLARRREELPGGSEIRPGRSIWLLAAAVLSALLAMKTKEIAFTLPFAVLLYEAFFFSGRWKRRVLYVLPLLATLPVVPLSVLRTPSAVGKVALGVESHLRAQTDMPRIDYLFTQFRVIVEYLRLLLLPLGQNVDYDHPVYTRFLDPPVFLSFLLLLALFGFAVWFYVGSTRRTAWSPAPASSALDRAPSRLPPEARLVAFGIFWFFLTLSVESSLIPIVDVLVEHRLYLPSIGVFVAVGAALAFVSRRSPSPRRRAGFAVAAVAALVSLCAATYCRNDLWRSDVRLWQDAVRKSPRKVSALNNLGLALNNAERPMEAVPVLTRAVQLAPYYETSTFNLARSYIKLQQWGAAEALLRKAIMAKPDRAASYSDLGAVLNAQERYREAATLLEQNLWRLGDFPEAHFNLGVSYFYLGEKEAARRELAVVRNLDPHLATGLADLVQQSALSGGS